jgi:hypothetical protein
MKLILSALFSVIAFSSFCQNDGEFHLDKEYPINAKGTLNLTITDAKVSVTGSDRKTAHVKIDRVVTSKGFTFGHQEFGFDVNENDGNLDLRERSHSFSVGVIGFYHEKYTINLELPNGVSLTVKGDDGHYTIANLAAAISFKVNDAHIELTGCTGNSFEFRMDDGTLKMDQGRGKFEIEGNDTNVHIQNGAFSEVRSDLDDGDLVMETSISDSGSYFIRTGDGLVSFTVLGGGGLFDVHHDDGHVTTEGNFNIVEKSEDNMRLTLATGKSNVNIRSNDGRVKLVSR